MDEWIADLPTLVRLAQTGSVNGAARALAVPRSTVSRRLARLEAELGVKLAERTTRSFRLTEHGRKLAEGAGRVLAELRTVREGIEQAEGSVRGWLRVCTPPGLGGPLLGRFLIDFRARFPEVRLELTVREHVPHLLDEDFDVAFVIGPQADAPWVRFPVGHLWHVAVARPGYLSARGRPAALSDLQGHVLLAVRAAPLRADVWPMLDGSAVRIEPQFVSSDLGAVADAARAGGGIALLPIHLVASDLAAGLLEPVLPDQLGRHLEVSMIYPAERRDSPLIRSLVGTLGAFRRVLQEELGG